MYSVYSDVTVSHSTVFLHLSNSETDLLRYVTTIDPEFARDGEFSHSDSKSRSLRSIFRSIRGSFLFFFFFFPGVSTRENERQRNLASRYRQRLAIPGRPTRTTRKGNKKKKKRKKMKQTNTKKKCREILVEKKKKVSVREERKGKRKRNENERTIANFHTHLLLSERHSSPLLRKLRLTRVLSSFRGSRGG